MIPARIRQFVLAWINALADTIAAVIDRSRGHRDPLAGALTPDGWQMSDERGRPLAVISEEAAAGDLRWMRRREIRAVLPESRIFRASLPPVPEESRDFLPAVVDLRVDRIAPWARQDRLTGFRTGDVDGGQITVDVAVTAQIFVAALIDAAIRNEARSLSFFGPADPDVEIEVPLPAAMTRQIGLRRIAAFGLAAFFAAAIAGSAVLGWQAYDIAEQRQLTEDQIAARMAVLKKAAAAAEGTGAAELDALDARKQSGPLAVITIEALSRLLPDDTHLVSLRYDGESVRIAGFTRSFQQLVPMLVTSPYFSDAKFSEPTERQPDGSDRFAIELMLKPVANIEAL